jgi:GntR family transcriptional regulator
MAQRGLTAISRVLDYRTEIPSKGIRTALLLPEGEEVHCIKRLRMVDGEPLALQTAFLPKDRFPTIDVRRLATSSLYQLLEEEYQVQLARAQEVYRPIILKRTEAAILKMRSRSAAFEVERTTFDVQKRPVEFVTSILRGDRMQLMLELVRKKGQGLVFDTKGGGGGAERSPGRLDR